MKGFGSDNHAGVHPELFQALQECNVDHAPSYGTDEISAQAVAAFKKEFGEHCEPFFVFNGTAANVLSLRFLCERFESVICSDVSHLNVDECGAPELFAGKLIPVSSTAGKLSLEKVKETLIRRGDQHYSQIRVLSITQPTELGTCYSLSEIRELTDWAHANQIFVHLDGARLTNAARYLKCNYKQLTTDLGVDVVSFGGTKNGFMMGEAVLILNPQLSQAAKTKFKYIRKQSAQLPSKTRYIGAQFLRYFSDELNLRISDHACAMAERLHRGLSEISQIQITCPCQSNAVFAIIPRNWVKIAREKYFFYIWDEKTFECRLMTSWDTNESEVDGLIHLFKDLAKSQ